MAPSVGELVIHGSRALQSPKNMCIRWVIITKNLKYLESSTFQKAYHQCKVKKKKGNSADTITNNVYFKDSEMSVR